MITAEQIREEARRAAATLPRLSDDQVARVAALLSLPKRPASVVTGGGDKR